MIMISTVQIKIVREREGKTKATKPLKTKLAMEKSIMGILSCFIFSLLFTDNNIMQFSKKSRKVLKYGDNGKNQPEFQTV